MTRGRSRTAAVSGARAVHTTVGPSSLPTIGSAAPALEDADARADPITPPVRGTGEPRRLGSAEAGRRTVGDVVDDDAAERHGGRDPVERARPFVIMLGSTMMLVTSLTRT